MEEFQVVKPSPLLAPYVKHYWLLKTDNVLPEQTRVVPTGHICMVFHRGERIFSDSGNTFQPRSFVSGQEKTFTDLIYTGKVDMICVVFNPIGAKAFFEIPMSEINGLHTDLFDLGDRPLEDLQKSLEEETSNEMSISLIEHYLLKRIRIPTGHSLERINKAIELINTRPTDINTLADASCLSPRQFNRVFTEFIGAKPKEFLRIVRFQRALFILQTQPDINLAQLAVECGYYDQPHLIKEFKAFSGYTPLEYLSICLPYSDYFS